MSVRLAVTYALLTAATLLVVAGLAINLTRNYLVREMDRRLVGTVQTFRDGPAGRVTRPEDLAAVAREWLGTYAFSQDEVGAVRTAQGEVLQSTGGIDLHKVPSAGRLLAATRTRWHVADTERGPVRALAVPLLLGDRHIGTFVVAASQTPIENTLDTLLSGVIWASGVGLAFATLLGFGMVRQTLRPLTRMLGEVESIQAAGDLSRRVGHSGPGDEVGRLARSFDRMLARLEQSFQSQQRFVSDASHELRTPLAVAKGHLELLSHALETPEGRRSLAVAGEELDRMHRIVEDLLLLARLDEGLPLSVRPVEVELELREALLRGMLLARRDATVNVEEGLYVLADPDRLLQILTNLVRNAVQHAGPEATLTLAGRRLGARVIIEVSDSGAGIPPEQLPRVFERFYRGGRARAGAPGGAGLGLAIAASLTRALGGDITVRSTPGWGSAFTISLPAPKEGTPALAAQPRAAAPAEGRRA